MSKDGLLLPSLPLSVRSRRVAQVTLIMPRTTFYGRLRYSSVDNKTKIKLVRGALINARQHAELDMLRLTRTEENQLNRLYRHEIIWALEQIAKSNDKLFLIPPSNYAETKRVGDSRIGGGEVYKAKQLADKYPITLRLLDNFDNWCEAELHKQSFSLKDLSEESREKVFRTIKAIDEQFELTSNPTVTLDWYVSSKTESFEARKQSLNFLANKEIVLSHGLKSWHGGAHIEVEINVKEFFKCRDEVFAFFGEKPERTKRNLIKSSKSMIINPFESIKGLKWEDISIRFVDGHNVKIKAKGTQASVGYKEMGFEDSRSLNPNSQWGLLKLLADHNGRLSWESSQANPSFKKKKQLLSRGLKSYFGIQEDPFHPYKEQKTYHIKLTVLPE
jgi:hypothetical protein